MHTELSTSPGQGRWESNREETMQNQICSNCPVGRAVCVFTRKQRRHQHAFRHPRLTWNSDRKQSLPAKGNTLYIGDGGKKEGWRRVLWFSGDPSDTAGASEQERYCGGGGRYQGPDELTIQWKRKTGKLLETETSPRERRGEDRKYTGIITSRKRQPSDGQSGGLRAELQPDTEKKGTICRHLNLRFHFNLLYMIRRTDQLTSQNLVSSQQS